jgi:hypothetical protein
LGYLKLILEEAAKKTLTNFCRKIFLNAASAVTKEFTKVAFNIFPKAT